MKSAISVSRWESDQSSQKSSGKSKTRTFWNYSEDVYNSEQNEISQGKQGRRKIQKSAGDEYFTSFTVFENANSLQERSPSKRMFVCETLC